MSEKTIFPREERTDMLFRKILNDSWACEKLQETFCRNLFCNDEVETPLSPKEFTQALFNSYNNKDLSAFLMAICQNTLFDLLRNSFLIPYNRQQLADYLNVDRSTMCNELSKMQKDGMIEYKKNRILLKD